MSSAYYFYLFPIVFFLIIVSGEDRRMWLIEVNSADILIPFLPPFLFSSLFPEKNVIDRSEVVSQMAALFLSAKSQFHSKGAINDGANVVAAGTDDTTSTKASATADGVTAAPTSEHATFAAANERAPVISSANSAVVQAVPKNGRIPFSCEIGICNRLTAFEGIWRHLTAFDGIRRHLTALNGIWR